MKRQTALIAALLLASAVFAGCSRGGPKTVTVKLKVDLDKECRPTIDESVHSEADLYPGDRLQWELDETADWTDCPDPEIEFAVRDIRHVADKDAADDFLLDFYLRGGAEAVRASLAPVSTQAEEADAAAQAEAQAARVAALESELNSLLEQVAAPSRSDPGPPFTDTTSGDFVPRGSAITSAPYRPLEADHLWKFDWHVQVKLADGEVASDIWDPHFRGHRR